ncbi:YpiF family protein [Bacillus sp. FJAT-49711]|uniref:YpiF family protein n=1 Tax=Bacillus sp. FJAT-49711 TaxID=2833585 RepID=UPI001BC9CE2A|nr:YpiF family protein [Bacillus sp. FJAT-49711]MBS4217313.1 YpiF family protein [Bacillus sp. FJAT-49711]
MNWSSKDITLFNAEREYIDTAVIPLMHVALDDGIKRAAEQGEFIQLLSVHLERQFKGRILVLPPFTYFKEPDYKRDELIDWSKRAKEAGFSYVFYLTSDPKWKALNKDLLGSLIYIPSIPLENMDEHYKHSVIDNQLKSLIEDIIKAWQIEND